MGRALGKRRKVFGLAAFLTADQPPTQFGTFIFGGSASGGHAERLKGGGLQNFLLVGPHLFWGFKDQFFGGPCAALGGIMAAAATFQYKAMPKIIPGNGRYIGAIYRITFLQAGQKYPQHGQPLNIEGETGYAGQMLLLACTSADLPLAYTVPAPQGGAEMLSKEVLQKDLQAFIQLLLDVDPREAQDAFDLAVTEGSDSCPQYQDFNEQDYYIGDCQTADGFAFYGYGLRNSFENAVINGAFHRSYEWMTGNMMLEGGERQWYRGDAFYADWEDQQTQTPHLDVYLWGDFYRPGSDWLGAEVSVEVNMHSVATSTGHAVSWEGGFSQLQWEGSLATTFSFNTNDVEVCALEPSGSIRFYGRNQQWSTLNFGDNCDGCGEVDGRRETVCADFSDLIQFEDRPWF